MLTYEGAGTVPATGPTPGIEQWKAYVLGRWRGGVDLGTFTVRNVRGGSSLSVHAVGRAWDWRYAGPGPGRGAADEAMTFAIEHHERLGIQAIHDYVACRIWRCSRPGAGPGWRQQRPGNGMGASWAAWLHFEVHPSSPLHQRSVADVMGGAAGTAAASAPPAAPTAALPMPTLRQGDRGPGVGQLQGVLAFWKYDVGKVDGDFGPRTKAAVTAWQQALQPLNVGRPDGVYGPRTHAAAAASYAALERLKAA